MLRDKNYAVRVAIDANPGREAHLLAPSGLSSPHGQCISINVEGGDVREIFEDGTGQVSLIVTPDAPTITLTYSFEPASAPYPTGIFEPMTSKYTRATDALLNEAREIAPNLAGEARQRAIAVATAQRFTYGHAKTRFNDGCDEVPALGCSIVEGSCVDINTYFIASLRAAGFDAGYAVGPFFPAEKTAPDGIASCNDMHCWVITRADDHVLEWDIAHHLKLGSREIAPSPNPKPGFRFAIGHSMGLNFQELGITDLKLLNDPVWVDQKGQISSSDAQISCAPT